MSKYAWFVFITGITTLATSTAQAVEMEVGALISPALTGTASSVRQVEPLKHYEIIYPDFVVPLSSFEAGQNDSNPVWAPTGNYLAFERSSGDKREIVISRATGQLMQTIYFQLSGAEKGSKEKQLFMPALAEDPSYNSGVSWANDSMRFVFMSNGGEGNYDIYSQELDGEVQRLTDSKEKDGLADWSPTSNQIVFVSGRSGKGDVYLLDPETRDVTQLTWGNKPYLYPRWSPDGKKIAMIYGSTENHDIYVMDDPAKPVESMRVLTNWRYDDLRPTWSPDGKKIAFYTNFNLTGEPTKWSLVVIDADGSDSVGGNGLAEKIVASDVIPDIEQGPAWLGDGSGLVYVKDDALEFNPIFVVDLVSMQRKLVKTNTKMNHDIACNRDGFIAFRAQLDQWDQIFIAKLPNRK